jgi:aminoglycoside/choline kinase family phosphotransferase
MILHKKFSQKFNFFLSLKNFTLIGIFVRIEEK